MIAIIDYEAGNVGSLANALERLGADYEITNDPAKVKAARGVILPGQGRAGPAMTSLQKTGLDQVIRELEQPFLGICLGMQVLVDESNEDNTKCLGIIPGSSGKFAANLPVPQMGWNKIDQKQQSPLLEGIENGAYQYFVHSYYVKTAASNTVATTDYGETFKSVIEKDNFYGVQFHPEKSGKIGGKILANFLGLCDGVRP